MHRCRPTILYGCVPNKVETSPGSHYDRGAGEGLSSVHPTALQPDWSLCYGKPLITPSRAPQEYLPCIFVSSLTSALPWQQTWSAQILSALVWAQVGLACDYTRMVVMQAMHKAVRGVYSAAPWSTENTMRLPGVCLRGVCCRPPPAMLTTASMHTPAALAAKKCAIGQPPVHRHLHSPSVPA